ncbi:nuclear transport factor 2 family protein [Natronospira bacteriovora]|uniref:Nuclear transport factor 2 family protein n=1 Tax=Natronospira bacteriovora TaxID=3069753 RepID=A0ABU0W9W0_9GAMM|nr:nuclear transport factor 2 family protein [Natronospira sp. AB-CW4]MDQ2070824.1 nuclear transport factor 2 family protein [Natronospira sp. AB-CW4]
MLIRWKSYVLLSLGYLLCASPLVAADDNSRLEAHLATLNHDSFVDYILHHDVTLYSRLTLPEYTLVVDIGIVETRDEVLATAENLSVTSLRVEHDYFARNGDTAMVSGLLHVEGTVMGHPIPPQLRYLSVFVEREGEWRLLARSLTAYRDPRQSPPPE